MTTKAERTELKSLVRQQFRVLRSEVDQRITEVVAHAHAQIDERYADEDGAWAEVREGAHAIQEEAYKKLDALMREKLGNDYSHKGWVRIELPRREMKRRQELVITASKTIEAQAAAAKLTLSRQEVDLLRELALGALESAAAKAFLDDIPTVAQLVPLARLAELEASLGDVEEGPW